MFVAVVIGSVIGLFVVASPVVILTVRAKVQDATGVDDLATLTVIAILATIAGAVLGGLLGSGSL